MPPPQTQWAQGTVDQRAPEDHEDHHRAELHSLCEGPADQRRRDHEEHALEEHVGQAVDGQTGNDGDNGLPAVRQFAIGHPLASTPRMKRLSMVPMYAGAVFGSSEPPKAMV